METVLPGKTGWLVEPGDFESLAEALREGLSNPEMCDNFGRVGQKWVLENFTVEKMCSSTLNLYIDLMATE